MAHSEPARQRLTSFPDSLAQRTAELCRKLANEREQHFEKLLAESTRERESLRAENARLRGELNERFHPVVANEQSLVAGRTTTGRVACLDSDSSREGLMDPSTFQSSTPSPWWDGKAPTANWSEGPWANFGLSTADNDHFFLRKAFKDVDRRKLHRICPEDVVHKMAQQSDDLSQAISVIEVREAFSAVNGLVGERCGREPTNSLSLQSGEVPVDELSFEGFKILVLQQDLEDRVSPEVAATIKDVREFYIKLMAEQMILEKTRVKKSELRQAITAGKLPWWLEPVVGTVILINAVTIGISQDNNPGALVWRIIEIVCAVLFALEIVIKVRYDGWREFFIGISWSWNWFDLGIVVLAILDILFEMLQFSDLGGVSIVRLVRLLRIARLVRLLRMKFFKELTLMVNGVLTGLKTLMWAFVFLFTLVYVFGVLMRQFLEPSLSNCSTSDSDTSLPTCSLSAKLLLDSNSLLFSTVFRSMFTVFRCLTGDCSGPEGYPLAPHLMDYLGDGFILAYFIIICFVLFGVFNLVMAIFVENTLEAARVNQQKRHALRQQEDIRVAQELRDIVFRICTRPAETPEGSKAQTPQRPRRNSRGPFNLFRRLINKQEGPDEEMPQAPEEDTMNMVVTRDVFQEVLDDPKALQILEDLEIPVTNHTKLFDIIDSNGSGQLDIQEIIDGLMKLRGPADKGDLVCAALMVRSVQRELKRLEMDIGHRHTQTLSILESLQLNSTSIQLRLDDSEVLPVQRTSTQL